MAPVVDGPPISVSFNSGYVAKTDSVLEIRCPDRHFRNAIVTDDKGDTLFTLHSGAPFTSWSMRRTLKDASGHHVWEIRHSKWKMKQWVVKDPQGKQLCTVVDGILPRFKGIDATVAGFTAVDARLPSEAGDTFVHMRSNDGAGTKTTFKVGGTEIAEMLLVENNDLLHLRKRGLNRTVWKISISEGVDMAVVLALAFCRCEICHAWRR